MYRELFLYVPCNFNDRSKHIVSEYKKKEMKYYSCDIVRMTVDLAYFSEGMINRIEFSPAYLHCERPTT